MRAMNRWKAGAITAAFLIFHLCVQFISWAYAMLLPVPWAIVSFPLFYIAGISFSTTYFWIVFFANSAIWSVLVFFLVRRR